MNAEETEYNQQLRTNKLDQNDVLNNNLTQKSDSTDSLTDILNNLDSEVILSSSDDSYNTPTEEYQKFSEQNKATFDTSPSISVLSDSTKTKSNNDDNEITDKIDHFNEDILENESSVNKFLTSRNSISRASADFIDENVITQFLDQVNEDVSFKICTKKVNT